MFHCVLSLYIVKIDVLIYSAAQLQECLINSLTHLLIYCIEATISPRTTCQAASSVRYTDSLQTIISEEELSPKNNLGIIEDKTTRHRFELEIENRFSAVSDADCVDVRETLRDSIQKTAKDVYCRADSRFQTR